MLIVSKEWSLYHPLTFRWLGNGRVRIEAEAVQATAAEPLAVAAEPELVTEPIAEPSVYDDAWLEFHKAKRAAAAAYWATASVETICQTLSDEYKEVLRIVKEYDEDGDVPNEIGAVSETMRLLHSRGFLNAGDRNTWIDTNKTWLEANLPNIPLNALMGLYILSMDCDMWRGYLAIALRGNMDMSEAIEQCLDDEKRYLIENYNDYDDDCFDEMKAFLGLPKAATKIAA